ncbi:hypothetical protein M2322_004039 [Rhodoblastus acidophilus]|uniref:hypothetical protein n=1 Tax=Rhodoblastus acidophilus TaxID=1074 RepID=UPI002224657A|nr:hypothetical protein [Rhodoblastus acidophilus]MCW2318470.1 hypothetical protein [Rhodoblastus acidophilus]
MKLAYCRPATAAPDFKPRTRADVRLCLEQCHADLAHQPASVARRFDRLLRRFARALEGGDAGSRAARQAADALHAQARQLEEMVAWLAALRRSHPESLQLQRNMARLLHEVFRTPEWRRRFIEGL